MSKIDFTIDKKLVLRYMGYKDSRPNRQTDRLIDSLISQCTLRINPRYISGRYSVSFTRDGIKLEGAGLLMLGNDIKNHLAGCEECFVICATAGAGADGFIRSMQAQSPIKALAADACATVAIECYCDRIEAFLRRQVQSEGKFLTWRYSPGYGDFPFTQQPEILSLLQAEKYTGVTANRACMMIPSKSVTAVMGIAKHKPENKSRSCANCPNVNSCDFSCRI